MAEDGCIALPHRRGRRSDEVDSFVKGNPSDSSEYSRRCNYVHQRVVAGGSGAPASPHNDDGRRRTTDRRFFSRRTLPLRAYIMRPSSIARLNERLSPVGGGSTHVTWSADDGPPTRHHARNMSLVMVAEDKHVEGRI